MYLTYLTLSTTTHDPDPPSHFPQRHPVPLLVPTRAQTSQLPQMLRMVLLLTVVTTMVAVTVRV